jgi:hypothetical protein
LRIKNGILLNFQGLPMAKNFIIFNTKITVHRFAHRGDFSPFLRGKVTLLQWCRRCPPFHQVFFEETTGSLILRAMLCRDNIEAGQ